MAESREWRARVDNVESILKEGLILGLARLKLWVILLLAVRAVVIFTICEIVLGEKTSSDWMLTSTTADWLPMVLAIWLLASLKLDKLRWSPARRSVISECT